MNVRTAVELCRLDLVRLVEAGDFRKMAAAESVIDAHLASLRSERDRNALLYHLGDELALVEVSDRPEADASLRAVRALLRRRVQDRFARAMLKSAAHSQPRRQLS